MTSGPLSPDLGSQPLSHVSWKKTWSIQNLEYDIRKDNSPQASHDGKPSLPARGHCPSESGGVEGLSGPRRAYSHLVKKKNSEQHSHDWIWFIHRELSWYQEYVYFLSPLRQNQGDSNGPNINLYSDVLPSLPSLTFVTYKMRIILISTSQGYCGDYCMKSIKYSTWHKMSTYEYRHT